MSYSNPMHHSTPGPWFAAATPNIGRPMITDKDGWTIAPRIENVSDARLIAAAPDLLAALQALLPHVPGYQSGDSAGRPWLDQARAAIAKASPC